VSTADPTSRRRPVLAIALPLGLVLWVTGPLILADRLLVYRDAAHFYYPTFHYAQEEWSAGSAPLWNDLEGLGSPMLGGGTSSVFYPGKAIFFILPFDAAYKVYIVGHLLLAAWAAMQLAQRWGAGTAGAALAALAYAGGGQVLSQCCNVVYLVSAAWLPAGMIVIDDLARTRSTRSALFLAVVLAAVTLGGDPQAAYHLVLIAAAYVWLVRRSERRSGAATASQHAGTQSDAKSASSPPRWRQNRLLLLALAAAMGLAVAAVQVLPSWELLRQSDRAESDVPRSLYELVTWRAPPEGGTPTAPWYAGLLARPSSPAGETSVDRATDFSVGPWRWPEFLWPNFSGRQYPEHRRWIEALPAEGRAWAPSLYLGCLPLLLALRCRAWRKATPQGRLMFWLCVVGLVGGLGEYGLGWLSRQAAAPVAKGATEDWPLGDAFGGLYWLLTLVLPGYAGFRYPGKLLVLFSLGASLLAGQGWGELEAESQKPQSPPRWRLAMALAVASAAGFVIALALKPWWAQWVGGAEPDALFGPLDARGAWTDLAWSLAQTLVVTAVGWCVVRFWLGQKKWAGVVVVVVTAVDLALANGWMLATAPASLWHDGSRVADAIQDDARRDRAEFYRVARADDWFPAAWQKSVSAQRQAEGVAFDRDTLSPKYHLLHDVPLLNSPETLANRDLQTLLLFSPLREDSVAARGADGRLLPVHPELPSMLAVRYRVLPPGQAPPAGSWEPLEAAVMPGLETRVWKNASAQPRAFVVYDVEVLPGLSDRRPGAIKERTLKVLFPGGQPRNLARTAVVEVDDASYWRGQLRAPAAVGVASSGGPSGKNSPPEGGTPTEAAPPGGPAAAECQMIGSSPQEVQLDVHLPSPGLVVLADLYYPGWTAEFSTRTASGDLSASAPVTVLRANRVLRGVWLPAGEHRVTFRYRPATFAYGGWTSALCCCAWCLALLGPALGARQKPRASRRAVNQPAPAN
jgi:hypothetical protein